MKKKLIITGANGFVAGSVIHQAGEEWEIHALARSEVAIKTGNVVPHVFDLLDFDALRRVFTEVKPDAVIHAAAVADIDFCEANKEEAHAVNVDVTRVVCRMCRETGARLVHCSTDTVFDGVEGKYTEADPPGAVNYYGKTKIEAENIVCVECPRAAVPRLCLVMGFPFAGGGNSFLSRMVSSLEAGKEVGVPDEEVRSPVDVVTLGRALLELAANDFSGFIHMAGNDVLNRYELGLRIADKMGFSRSLVVAKNPSGIPGRAPRPRNVSLDNSLARDILKTPMLDLGDAIDLVIKTKTGATS